jgi:hypothetical protein
MTNNSNIIPLAPGWPLTAQQIRSLKAIRRDLSKTVMPLNAEMTLAAAVVGIIDAMVVGADEPQEQTKV